MTINLSYYKTRLLENYPDINDRHLLLRYLEGCALSPGEEIVVLHNILNIIDTDDPPITYDTIDEYENHIEMITLTIPKGGFSAKDDAQLRKYKAQGLNNRTVAEKMMRNVGSINRRWNDIK